MVENGSTDSLVIVPVKKNSAISARMLVVVAIELGTFFSQYAYSFQSEFITNPLQFRSCYWPNDHHSKAPSVLLFNPDKSFNSFGYRAQRNYFNLLEHDPDKAATYYFVKNFKIQLFNKKIGLEMMIKDISGKELSAITVFTEAIRFLKDHFIGMFTTQKLNLSFKDVFFVVPVPATWNKSALQFMMVASEKAGIKSSQMTLVYEPDAVVLYYSMLQEDQSIARYLKEGHRIMIVDIGYGTTDITVVKVLKRKEKLTYIEHVYKVSRVACEDKQVDKKFEKYLESVFGIDVMDEFKVDHRSQYLKMIEDFERRIFLTYSKHIGVSIRFAGELRNIYNRKRGKDILKDIQNNSNNSVRIVGDKLISNASWTKVFFQDCKQEILNHINETIFKTGFVWPSALIVDGKYSDAPLIQEAIVETFPLINNTFFPRMSSSALTTGSVIFGYEPAIVTCRVCRETLGLTFRLPYVLEGQTEKKTFKIDGKLRADKSFQKMFSINEIIELEQTRTVAIQDIQTHKELLKHPKIIEVYASQDKNPKYITDAGCSLRGKITVNPPNGEWPENAEGFIDMETGGTEIIVRYRDKHSGQITEETMDFM